MLDYIADETEDSTREWRFQLFVVGKSPQSRQAIADLNSIVETFGDEEVQITVIDLFDDPDIAVEKDILAIPTLIRERPLPVLRIIGDLSDKNRVCSMLSA